MYEHRKRKAPPTAAERQGAARRSLLKVLRVHLARELPAAETDQVRAMKVLTVLQLLGEHFVHLPDGMAVPLSDLNYPDLMLVAKSLKLVTGAMMPRRPRRTSRRVK